MDTKSKSNRKTGILTAIVLVLIAAVSFSALYPVFGKKAEEYAASVLGSESFLTELYWGNRVLYRELAEKVSGRSVRYSDLFLQVEEYTWDGTWDSENGYVDIGGKDLSEMAEADMNELMESHESHMLEGISNALDYCAVDHGTGERISNTGNEIENLGMEQAAPELTGMYPYYVKMSFDDAGYLENVWVRGENPEELLKRVRSIMKSKKLESEFFDAVSYSGWYSDGEIYFWQDSQAMKGQVNVENGLKGMTVCYALTEDQKEALISVGGGYRSSYLYDSYRLMSEYAYFVSGTDSFLKGFLLVLGAAAFFLPLWKRYTLHKSGAVRIYLELQLAAILLWFSLIPELVLQMVYAVNSGYFRNTIQNLAGGIFPKGADIISWVINLVFLILVFGSWYYFITALGGVYELGIAGFLKERSLILRLWERIYGFGKRKIREFKDEILHVDLGEKADKVIFKLVAVNFIVLAIACMMWMFGWAALLIYSIILYFMLKKYVKKIQEQYHKLLAATKSIAKGNLQTEFEGDWGVFESYKQELCEIQTGFSKAVEEEVRSQRMKTELITNVSHDLKTPLTAIITYIELLAEENISEEQRKEYLEVVKRKAARLKFLIEDLFEVSKATSGNVVLNPVDVDICNLMRQIYLEYEDKVEEADLIFRFSLPEEKVVLKLDSQKTYRIFENLYINIIKYAMPHTRVYIHGEKTEKGIRIELKNMSATELNISPQDLTERFVRGDSSRNTEGSGLGLAIARSFVELQGGSLKVEIDGDLFKVTIVW